MNLSKSVFDLIRYIPALCLFGCPIMAHADIYEVRMHQVEPDGISIKMICVSDQAIERPPCAKTFQMPISIDGEDKIVDVAVIIKPSSKQIMAEFAMENRYFLSMTGAYYLRYERYVGRGQTDTSKVGLFPLTDKNAKIPFKSHPVLKEPIAPIADIEITVSRHEDK